MLMVLLVGTMVMLVSISVGMFALQAVKMSNSRGESIKALYNAEDAFECVRYWIRKDFKNFYSDQSESPTPTCNGQQFPNTPTSQTITSSIDGSSGTSTFRIWVNTGDHSLGGVRVSVGRNLSAYSGGGSGGYFDGYIEVRGYNDDFDNSPKTNERMQRYQYRPSLGADIMFVVDRSGSIDGTRTGTISGEWEQLYNALNMAVTDFGTRIPQPQMGIVTFGTDADDTGVRDSHPSCPSGESCVVRPDVPLTTASPYPLGNMLTTVSNTNLSLGLAVAGLELMNEAYPAGSSAAPPSFQLGNFEDVVMNGSSWGLPSLISGRDRLDDVFPDYIIVITDGNPNAIIRDQGSGSSAGDISCYGYSNDVLTDPSPTARNAKGDSLVFHVNNQDFGCIVEDGSVGYPYCNDGMDYPTDYSDYSFDNNSSPNQARCNATLVADWIKHNNNGVDNEGRTGVTIAVIGVGLPDTDTEDWMKGALASDPSYYAPAANYGAVTDAILTLLERLNLIQAL